MGMLDNKVILITGGGRGIGRECALLAAKEGAKVVVNDLGGGLGDAGTDQGDVGPAEEVAEEIRGAGGQAVSNSGSITNTSHVKEMFEQCLDTYGQLDSVINPAGILRDGMFHKMSEEDWDAVIEVHLKGTFNITRETVNYFRDRQDGNYVLFTSTSGLIGNLGQANYAAAKMGIAGLSRIIAMEGAIKNVRSNIIAPFAWTRMIASIPVKDEASRERVERLKQKTRADQVALCAVGLCADGAKDVSGQIFCVRGNEVVLFSQPRPVRSVADTSGWTVETLVEQGFKSLATDFTDLGASASVFPHEPL